jgi:hypothetical protein
MAAKHASVKLSRELLDVARREAETFNRSLGAQVEHWALLGRATENSPGASMDRIRAALAGRSTFEQLTTIEQTAFLEQFGAEFEAETREAYTALGREVGAVGRDEEGRLVRRQADGSLKPID